MREYWEIAEELRHMIRATNTPEDAIPAWKILRLAETFENKAEVIEMEMIVQMQNDWVEASLV